MNNICNKGSGHLFLPLIFCAGLCATFVFYACSRAQPTEPAPTSHNWRFEMDTLGGGGSGVRGVVAFTKDDAWATGNFYRYPDPSNPNNAVIYDLAHWDGKRWTYFQMPDLLYHDGGALFALAPDFMLAYSYGLHLYDGTEWNTIQIPYGAIHEGVTAMWTDNRTQVHCVGGKGTWVRWNGSVKNGSFTTIATPTDIDFKDIYGDGGRIFACGVSPDYGRSIVLKYENSVFTVIDSAKYPGEKAVNSVWYHSRDDALAYAGTYEMIIHNGKKQISDTSKNIPYCLSVRGTGINNVWFVGHYLYIVHYNGLSFKVFANVLPKTGVLKNIDVHEEYFFAGGYIGLNDQTARGVIVRGYVIK
jgi:hypothetical protein